MIWCYILHIRLRDALPRHGQWPAWNGVPEVPPAFSGGNSPKRSGWKIWLPSGKHTNNYGKSQFLIGESSINGYFQ